MREDVNFEKDKLILPESEAAELSLTENRDFEEYKRELRFDEGELSEKEILDLGSGPETKFAKDIKEKFPEAHVVSFDFSFKRDARDQTYGRFSASPKLEANTEKVSGLFTKLPFKNESFDMIVSSAAMPLYLNNAQQIKEAFHEVVRVLKKGGKAHIGPVSFTDILNKDDLKPIWETHKKHSFEESKMLFENILKGLEDEIEFEFLPAITKEKFNRYFGDTETIQVKPAVLIITKRFY